MEAFSENVKIAHLQAIAWKYHLDSDPPDLSPESIAWLQNKANLSLYPKLYENCLNLPLKTFLS